MLAPVSTDSADKGPLILYVDDERPNRIVFEQSFGDDFNIITAASGSEALDLMQKHEVAVLVTDMRMPDMSGEELLLIAKERFPQTMRMVVTAYPDINPILRAINEGTVSRYVVKPWEHNELMLVLRWACETWTFGRDQGELHARLLQVERLATLGSMAGMFAHDLSQPLMSIIANIELVQGVNDIAPLLAEVVRRSQEIPQDVRAQMLSVVNDLPAVTADMRAAATHMKDLLTIMKQMGKPARSSEGSTAIAPDPLMIVRHSIAVCQGITVGRRAQIAYQGPNDLPAVRMSPTELTQVLINIVANAAQAVTARGIPDGRVTVGAKAYDRMLEISVRDEGVGITPEVLKRLGTPFFTTRAEGSGVGLAQCQRLVGSAGGRFLIESEPGVGTLVTIILPLAA